MIETVEKTIDINGVKTKYQEILNNSNKETVLILHGWDGSSFSWLQVANALAENNYNVILPDLPGFGETSPPSNIWGTDEYVDFLHNFVATFGIEKFYLVGHSFGGALALKYATNYPSEIKKLVLCDAAIIRKERLNLRQKTAKILARTGSKIASKTPFYPLLKKITYKLAGTHDYYRANSTMREIFKKIIKEDMLGLSEKIRVPCLILWGQLDKATPIEDAFTLSEQIEGSTLKIISDSGHNPHRSHSSETAKIIISYLNK
ncbi:MAG: alpha/beta hydrolase [Candidatus Paceibacterota bacterium]